MIPRRFARSLPRWTTAALAGFFTLQCLIWWEWFALELRPLERYYFPTYFHSIEAAKRVSARTRIEPLFKTFPGKKRELILMSDLISGGDGNSPVQLSRAALGQGWIGIDKGSPKWNDSAAVKDFLREDFLPASRVLGADSGAFALVMCFPFRLRSSPHSLFGKN